MDRDELLKKLSELDFIAVDLGLFLNTHPDNKEAIQAYNQLHGETFNYGDICKIDETKLPYYDLITYSSPCQDFSVAGKQAGGEKGSGTRSSLLWECERIIRAVMPKYLLMENVKALTSKKFMPLFQRWLNTLESIGYQNYWKVLNAKDYGVPQNRERVFGVSILGGGNYEFPQPIKLEKRLKDVLEPVVDEKYYLSDRYLKYVKNKEIKDYNFPVEFSNPETVRKTPLKAQGDRAFVVQHIGNRMPKITEQYRIRKLTPRECWRLMGVRDEQFDKLHDISNSQLYKIKKRPQRGLFFTVSIPYWIIRPRTSWPSFQQSSQVVL